MQYSDPPRIPPWIDSIFIESDITVMHPRNSCWAPLCTAQLIVTSPIASFMGPTWGPPGSCRPHVGPTLALWTLLSGTIIRMWIDGWSDGVDVWKSSCWTLFMGLSCRAINRIMYVTSELVKMNPRKTLSCAYKKYPTLFRTLFFYIYLCMYWQQRCPGNETTGIITPYQSNTIFPPICLLPFPII